ncbi:MAG: GIY-YIG nuclease family protein [bacterium]|jgi:group I intron endonuclease
MLNEKIINTKFLRTQIQKGVKICGIYKITSPLNKTYIGQSTNIYKRWLNYFYTNCKNQKKLYNSLKKYGVSNHVFEVLHNCEKEELNFLEDFYIKFYDCLSLNGLNYNFSEMQIQDQKIKKDRYLKKLNYNREYSKRKRALNNINNFDENQMLDYMIKVHSVRCLLGTNEGVFMLDFKPIKNEIGVKNYMPF